MAEDDISREVDEALRQERLQQLWKRMGSVAAVASLVIVLVTIAIVWHKDSTERANAAATHAFAKAVRLQDSGDHLQAAAVLADVQQPHQPAAAAADGAAQTTTNRRRRRDYPSPLSATKIKMLPPRGSSRSAVRLPRRRLYPSSGCCVGMVSPVVR